MLLHIFDYISFIQGTNCPVITFLTFGQYTACYSPQESKQNTAFYFKYFMNARLQEIY